MCDLPTIQDLEPVDVFDLYLSDVEDNINEHVEKKENIEEQEEQGGQVLIVKLTENDVTFSDIEEIINRPSDYERPALQSESDCLSQYQDKCSMCEQMFVYNDLRMCYKCLKTFCDSCALPVNVSVLQCCNCHCLILWFCSAQCREGLTRATV